MTLTRTAPSRFHAGLPSPLRRCTPIAVAVAVALGVSTAPVALAQDDSSTAQQIQALKTQVDQLQRQLDGLQAKEAAATNVSAQQQASNQPAAPRAIEVVDRTQAATSDSGGSAPPAGPAIQAGPLTITFGGFTELALIYRNHDELADVGSVSYASLPFPDAEQYNLTEFRESARQSRFSMLTQAEPWNGARTEAYLETDFLGAAPTANSRESNSYNLRVRNFYARFILDSGFYVLAGQSWSLATLYKQGLDPRNEDVPLTIDAQYVAGFNWTRNPQLRFVQKFSNAFSLGFSIESPQAVPNASNNVPSTVSAYPANTYYQPTPSAGGLLDSTTGYSVDPAPDLILKAALDPGYGHYELYTLGRWFRSAVGTDTTTVFGGSIGGGAELPIVPDVLSFQFSGLAGKGIGRYGSAQLPDATLEPNGTFSPLKGYQALFGLFYKPVPSLQIYAYAGREKVSADYFDETVTTGSTSTIYGYGYGNPLYNNTGCYILGSSKCVANAQEADEVTGGFWWKYYKGELGNLQLGLQVAYNQVDAFGGVGGAPSTNVFETMVSFRYYPFQN
jgi:hypothetical protein